MLNITLRDRDPGNRTVEFLIDNDVEDNFYYSLYRKRIMSTDGVPSLGNDVLLYQISYDGPVSGLAIKDTNCIDMANPSTPVITSLNLGGDNKLSITYESNDNGSVYEYHVRARSKTTDLVTRSNILTVECYSEISHYEISVVKGHEFYDVIPNDRYFIKTIEGRYITGELTNGYYAIFIRAYDTLNYVSDVLKYIYYVGDKEKFYYTKQTPIGVRYNNRYRGPQESKKASFMYSQIKSNLNKLKDRIDKLESRKESMLVKPNTSSYCHIGTIYKNIEEIMMEVKKEGI